MPEISPFASSLHALASTVWVGGMFFAHMILRPSLLSVDPPVRLPLWKQVFRRFFFWVWISVVVLAATGYMQVYADYGDFDSSGLHISAMHILGLVMFALFALLYVFPYRRFCEAVDATDWPRAAENINVIRRIVTTNLLLGLINVVIGASGRFWS